MEWTKERPDNNDIYWCRQSGMLPELLLVQDGFVYDFGDGERTSIGFYDDRGEWLGPITPEQAEQFDALRTQLNAAADLEMLMRDEISALRKAAEDALQSLDDLYTQQQRLSHPDTQYHLPIYKQARTARAALRRALGKEQSEVTKS